MKKFLKNNWWYIIIFLVVFIILSFLGFIHNYGDPINNYGFGYAISKGEIPYLDFNMISTPLYAFYISLGLNFFNYYIVYLLEQTLLVTVTFYFLYQLFGKKASIMLLVTAISLYSNIIGTYNYMCFFLMIVLIFLEKKYSKKDYLIGFCIGLACLSKQTIGPFLLIPSIIFYHKEIKKLLKRFIGFLIPCLVFLIYLIVNKALVPFFDLCLFGLFDFGSKNGLASGKIDSFYLILTILSIILSIIVFIKHKKDISNYYLFLGLLFVVPLFDQTHFAMYLNCIIVMLLPYIKIKEKSSVCLTLAISIPIMILTTFMWPYKLTISNSMKHFEKTVQIEKVHKSDLEKVKFIKKFKEPIIIGYFSMKYNLINDNKITYFDVLYNGNFGYKGNIKMINKIKKMHNQIFAVAVGDYKSKYKYSQFAKDVALYVVNNCKKIDSKYGFDIYYKE